jgi:hypothetical protein
MATVRAIFAKSIKPARVHGSSTGRFNPPHFKAKTTREMIRLKEITINRFPRPFRWLNQKAILGAYLKMAEISHPIRAVKVCSVVKVQILSNMRWGASYNIAQMFY